MSDTQQAAEELWRYMLDTYPWTKDVHPIKAVTLALTQAEQRGEQRGMERAAGMVEGEYWGWTPQALAKAIRAAKEKP